MVVSIDRLNKKIQHEYALTIRDKFPQSINHRPYFIKGALEAFQMHTKREMPAVVTSHRWIALIIILAMTGLLSTIGLEHIQSTRLLDKVSKELLAYDSLSNQNSKQANPQALYHLTRASSLLSKIHSNTLLLPALQQFKTQLKTNTTYQLRQNFLPALLAEIEQTIIDSRQSHVARYNALKIYLMLGQPAKLSYQEIQQWFKDRWQNEDAQEVLKQKLALLNETLRQPFQSVTINQQIISDAVTI